MKIHNTYFRHANIKFASLLLVTAVSFSSLNTDFATSRKSQAQDAKKTAESNLNSVNNSINNITTKQQQLQKEINALDADLVELLVNMDILSDELAEKRLEIEQANKDLKAAQKTETEQYERMKKRIRYMYESGDDTLLEALLGATSMSDFLNRVNYCTAVYDYDREQLEVYNQTKQEVIDLKAQLLNEQSEMEEMQDNYKLQEADLKEMVAQKESTMDDFASQLSQAKILATQYKETIQQQNQIIRDEEEKERIAAEEAARAAAAAERAAREAAAAEQAAREEEARRRAAAQAQAQQQQQQAAANTAGGTSGSGSTPGSGGTSSSGGSSAGSSSGSGSTPAVSPSGATGSDVINYATQFIGNPYVWGGTSLTNGADCSGFVMSVYAHFGYSLPHSSAAMAGCGRGVSYSEAQPGDLICYSGHVALYMGGGRIVGAQSSRTGITTQNATYRTIIAVRRIIN